MAKSKLARLARSVAKHHRKGLILFVVACAFMAGSGVGAVIALRGSEVISRCAYYLGPPI
jgi:hypothetical protein